MPSPNVNKTKRKSKRNRNRGSNSEKGGDGAESAVLAQLVVRKQAKDKPLNQQQLHLLGSVSSKHEAVANLQGIDVARPPPIAPPPHAPNHRNLPRKRPRGGGGDTAGPREDLRSKIMSGAEHVRRIARGGGELMSSRTVPLSAVPTPRSAADELRKKLMITKEMFEAGQLTEKEYRLIKHHLLLPLTLASVPASLPQAKAECDDLRARIQKEQEPDHSLDRDDVSQNESESPTIVTYFPNSMKLLKGGPGPVLRDADEDNDSNEDRGRVSRVVAGGKIKLVRKSFPNNKRLSKQGADTGQNSSSSLGHGRQTRNLVKKTKKKKASARNTDSDSTPATDAVAQVSASSRRAVASDGMIRVSVTTATKRTRVVANSSNGGEDFLIRARQ